MHDIFYVTYDVSEKYLCASSWQNWCHSETDIVDVELPGEDCRISNGPGDSIEKACAV